MISLIANEKWKAPDRYHIGAGLGTELRLSIMEKQLEQVVRNAVAEYRLRLASILGRSLETPFPLYYPGMPAYDWARERLKNESNSD